jgi:hypothetical protein
MTIYQEQWAASAATTVVFAFVIAILFGAST